MRIQTAPFQRALPPCRIRWNRRIAIVLSTQAQRNRARATHANWIGIATPLVPTTHQPVIALQHHIKRNAPCASHPLPAPTRHPPPFNPFPSPVANLAMASTLAVSVPVSGSASSAYVARRSSCMVPASSSRSLRSPPLHAATGISGNRLVSGRRAFVVRAVQGQDSTTKGVYASLISLRRSRHISCSDLCLIR
jgi:hypothetical protein